MAVVDQAISTKAIEPEVQDVTRALNREVVPVVRRLRAAVNERLNAAATTFGDGVSLVADVEHPFNTTDVFVSVYNIATGMEVYYPTVFYERTSASNVRVTFAFAPSADNARILVRT
jgi:hypothetical protein